MSGGFSHKSSDLTLAHFLSSTAPLFIPSGEKVAGTVSVIPHCPQLRAFFLPTVANLPIGLFWKTKDISVSTMINSIKAWSQLPVSHYASFISILESLGRVFHDWILVATCHPAAFACQVFLYNCVESQFPNLVAGAVPDTVTCSTTFAPLMDMRYLHGWRILVDRILSGAASHDISFFRLFLSRASACLHSGADIGTELLPELTPCTAIHFKIHGGWPSNTPDPLVGFARPELSSPIAQGYDIISIEVHADRPAPAPTTQLITASEASARRHKAMTPKTTVLPVDLLASPGPRPKGSAVFSPSSQSSRGTSNQDTSLLVTPRPGSRSNPLAPSTPSGTNLFGVAVCSPPDLRSSQSLSVRPSAMPLLPVVSNSKWPEVMTWSLENPTTRGACAPEYLMSSILLIHGHSLLDITADTYQVCHSFHQPGDKQLVRPPNAYFCSSMLLPIFHGGAAGIVDTTRIYVQGIIDHQGDGYFSQFFSQSFFQASLLRCLIQPASWHMEDSFDPQLSDPNSFQIYQFLPCLGAYSAQPALLPAKWLACLKIRPLALFVLSWFRSMDIAISVFISRALMRPSSAVAYAFSSKSSSATASKLCGPPTPEA